ncbi:multicopper oxidase family protein [Nakamurella flava]|uniref:Multicopper oxidase family protein n=1 Tax=Nakamurella flava TaxID=2576308 RepID=A0A4U6QJR4_9ACTN|nr:multicopper oxidase domain-containing protein [Nakamurella flava]TKV60683.1 multicopper oxidase family protein [Nakamurella flava]
MPSLSRRDAFKLGGLAALGAAGLAIPWGAVDASSASLLPSSKMPKPYQVPFARLEALPKNEVLTDQFGQIDVYRNEAKLGKARIVPNMDTPVLGYEGKVPGRMISVEQGTRVQMAMRNQLPEVHPTFGTPTRISTHLHGSASLPQYDGYASDVTEVGQKKLYHYPNFQSARTLWYHDHGVHFTSQNAYSGLAAQYHLHDPMERALLPQNEFDVGLTVSDMMFQADGSQLWDDRSHSGLWGDVILVNGAPWPVMKVKRRVYRFRVLNASISRSYNFSTSPAAPMYMVATDGGLMPVSQNVSSWRHGSAERYEVLIDFSGFKAGTRIELRNASNPNNRDYDNTGKVMAFDVVDDGFDPNDPTARTIPQSLNPGNDIMRLTPASSMKVRNIRVERSDSSQQWMLNGQTWDDVIKSGYTSVLANPNVGDTEIWEIENKSGGWFHPVHIHLIDFRILSRNGKDPFAYEKGPKDVVYVGEGEKVRLIMKFGDITRPDHLAPRTGKYMVHCHNLAHEDHDMMHQFSVGQGTPDAAVNDPINADKPCGDDESFVDQQRY